MSEKFAYQMKSMENYMFVKVSGKFDLSQAQNFITTVIEKSHDTGLNRILIDARSVTGIDETLDRYKMGEFISKISPMSMKIAFLVSEKQILPDKFFENVAKNRMLNAFVTTNFEEAKDWLFIMT